MVLALAGSVLLWIMDRCLQHGKIEMTCVQRKLPQNEHQRKSVWQWMRKYLKQRAVEQGEAPHVELQTPRASLEIQGDSKIKL